MIRVIRAIVGALGAWCIQRLIWIFGRTHRDHEIPWLIGPVGGDHIGDRPYEETAQAEGLTLERHAASGGLIPAFAVLGGDDFDPGAVHPAIRAFYEDTAAYQIDAWATTYFPARVALWLLVTTISRRVDQLNVPLDGLDTAHGMTSEIVLLRRPDGQVRYTGWFRTLRKTGRAIYTGFYTTEHVPRRPAACVKVIFPMPGGNATVILRPIHDQGGGLFLDSDGAAFGDVGFYRLARVAPDACRVWRVSSLKERFHLFVDDDGTVRCDHHIRFLGLRVLDLHYKITPRS